MGLRTSYKTTTIASYMGSIVQAISVNVPPVLFIIFQNEYGVSYTQLGTLVMITFFLQILVDLLLARIGDRVSTRFLMVTCAVLSMTGYGLMALAPTLFPGHVYGGLLVAVVVYSCASGILEVMTSPIIDAIPSEDKGSSMAFLHSFYCWGQLLAVLVTTLLLAVLGQQGWQRILVLWMIPPAICGFLFSICPLPDIHKEPEKEKVSGNATDGTACGRAEGLPDGPTVKWERTPGKSTGKTRRVRTYLWASGLFWAALMVMIASGASEQSMAQWASLFAQKAVGVTKTVGDIAGPCLFALLMGSGRLFYGIMGERLNMKRALIISGVLCIVSYLLAIFAPYPWMSLLGLGLCGLSVSMMWPGTLVLSSKAMPKGGARLFALLAMGGDIGCSLGPWLTGLVSGGIIRTIGPTLTATDSVNLDELALKAGLFTAIIFPILLIIFIPKLTKRNLEETT